MTKGLELPSVGQNMFVDLAEKIAGELNVSQCWVCGGPQMAEEWPWRGTSLTAREMLKGNYTFTSSTLRQPEGCMLSFMVPGDDCLQRTG
ncbi:ENR1 protein, partial [Campylorhamphus procurvoides]|nr:ENR1 protein [Campylorhamphus procurvoides]